MRPRGRSPADLPISENGGASSWAPLFHTSRGGYNALAVFDDGSFAYYEVFEVAAGETTVWTVTEVGVPSCGFLRVENAAACGVVEFYAKLPAATDRRGARALAMEAKMNYPSYRKRGLPIGSGVVESSCKHVVGERLKGPGMRWDEEGAESILALRSHDLNGRWDPLWTQKAAA